MFKMFQMDEYLRTWRDKIDIAGGRDAGKICAKTGEFNSKMSYFRNANGIIYCDWEMRFNGDVQMISRHEWGYNFLWFNTGETLALSRGAKFDEFGGGHALLGKTGCGFEGVSRFYGAKNYRAQFILFSDELAGELEIFGGFAGRENEFKDLKIDMASKFALGELQNAEIYDGKLKEIFIESKILDLIYKYSCDAGKANLELNFGGGGVKFDDHNIKAIKKAREVLFADIANPPSIKTLARSCAINEFKLKKGFKMIFGTTIYGALRDRRLQIARELLMRRDISISEAATLVGYKSPGHFSRIFSKAFGNHYSLNHTNPN